MDAAGSANVTDYVEKLIDTRCSFGTFYILYSSPNSVLVSTTIAVVVINTFVSFFGILLNAFVLAAYTQNKRLQTPPNMLLLVLACSDLLVAAVANPVFIAKKLKMIASSFDCFLWTFNRLIFYGTCGLSLSVISILSVERLITLRFPYRHQNIITKKRLKIAVVVAVLVIILGLISQALDPPYEALAVLGASVIFINMALVVSIWVWIHRVIRRHKSNIEASFHATSTNARVIRSTKTSYLIVGSVLCCYLPNFVGHVYFSVKPDDFGFFNFVTPWLDTLALGNSLLNPMILFKRKRNFRETVKVLVGARTSRDNSSE